MDGSDRVELWRGEYTGKLPRVNQMLGAICVGGHGRIYQTPAYRKLKADMIVSFRASAMPITGLVDLFVTVRLWKQRDTDGPIKAIMDSLEAAGVIANDGQIRDVFISREYHKRDEDDRLRVSLWA